MSRTHKKSPEQPSSKDQRIAELEMELVRERANNQRVQRDNLRLQKLLEQLQAQVVELQREGKRQAAPFARRKRVEHPKKPGRKAGQGKFSRREPPAHRQVDRTKKAKLHGCPECGGKLRDIQQHEQYVTDIPETIQLVTTRYLTYSGYCAGCHKRVRSRHPEQTSQATGAAGVLVGPRAKALAADLKHRLGGSYAKVSEALNDYLRWMLAPEREGLKHKPEYAMFQNEMQRRQGGCAPVEIGGANDYWQGQADYGGHDDS